MTTRLRAIRLFTSKISDAVSEGRQSFEQSQIAEQKAAEGAPRRSGMSNTWTPAPTKSYEKQEGDFVEGEPAAEPAAAPSVEEAVAPSPATTRGSSQ